MLQQEYFCSFLHLSQRVAQDIMLSSLWDLGELRKKKTGWHWSLLQEDGHGTSALSTSVPVLPKLWAEQSGTTELRRLLLLAAPTAALGSFQPWALPKNTPAMHLSDLKMKTHCVRAGQCYIALLGIIKDDERNDWKIPNWNYAARFYMQCIRDLEAGYVLLQSDKFNHKESKIFVPSCSLTDFSLNTVL